MQQQARTQLAGREQHQEDDHFPHSPPHVPVARVAGGRRGSRRTDRQWQVTAHWFTTPLATSAAICSGVYFRSLRMLRVCSPSLGARRATLPPWPLMWNGSPVTLSAPNSASFKLSSASICSTCPSSMV